MDDLYKKLTQNNIVMLLQTNRNGQLRSKLKRTFNFKVPYLKNWGGIHLRCSLFP